MRPERIAGVLRAIDADIVALQEVVGAGPHGGGHAEELGAALGMGWVMAPARQLRGHQFGNAVLSRLPITQHIEHDLSWKTCEPRRMQRVDISAHGGTLHSWLIVHPGTAILERRHLRQSGSRASSATGTVNGRSWCWAISTSGCGAWRTSLLNEKLHSVDSGILSRASGRSGIYSGSSSSCILDHIYYAGKVGDRRRRASPRTRCLSLVVSDHLPLVADIRNRQPQSAQRPQRARGSFYLRAERSPRVMSTRLFRLFGELERHRRGVDHAGDGAGGAAP